MSRVETVGSSSLLLNKNIHIQKTPQYISGLRTLGKLVNQPHITTDILIRWRSEKIAHDIENRGKKRPDSMPRKY